MEIGFLSDAKPKGHGPESILIPVSAADGTQQNPQSGLAVATASAVEICRVRRRIALQTGRLALTAFRG
jgi:hypothetical protein